MSKRKCKFIRLSELASTKGKPGKLPVSPATIWRWLREEKNGFPKPFKLSEGVTAWDADEIDAFIARCAGVSA